MTRETTAFEKNGDPIRRGDLPFSRGERATRSREGTFPHHPLAELPTGALSFAGDIEDHCCGGEGRGTAVRLRAIRWRSVEPVLRADIMILYKGLLSGLTLINVQVSAD